MLQFARDIRGPRWLLEHGADPNLAWGDDNEGPLHVAARRWNLELVELLVTHGADVMKRRGDGRTPHTLAEMNGNHDIAIWLLAHGAVDELSPLERFAAACARGDRAQAEAMLAREPHLRGDLRHEHHLMLHRQAESGHATVLDTMLACGFDPAVADKDNVTPLHRAAMSGHVDAVRVLLSHGAPVNALDGMFSATPLVWAVEGRGSHRKGEHVGVARLLIAAGSSLEWTPPPGAPDPEGTIEGLIELRRAASEKQQ
jgi:ankyrin repeat protein